MSTDKTGEPEKDLSKATSAQLNVILDKLYKEREFASFRTFCRFSGVDFKSHMNLFREKRPKVEKAGEAAMLEEFHHNNRFADIEALCEASDLDFNQVMERLLQST